MLILWKRGEFSRVPWRLLLEPLRKFVFANQVAIFIFFDERHRCVTSILSRKRWSLYGSCGLGTPFPHCVRVAQLEAFTLFWAKKGKLSGHRTIRFPRGVYNMSFSFIYACSLCPQRVCVSSPSGSTFTVLADTAFQTNVRIVWLATSHMIVLPVIHVLCNLNSSVILDLGDGQ